MCSIFFRIGIAAHVYLIRNVFFISDNIITRWLMAFSEWWTTSVGVQSPSYIITSSDFGFVETSAGIQLSISQLHHHIIGSDHQPDFAFVKNIRTRSVSELFLYFGILTLFGDLHLLRQVWKAITNSSSSELLNLGWIRSSLLPLLLSSSLTFISSIIIIIDMVEDFNIHN